MLINLVRVLLLVNLVWVFYLLSDLELYGMEQRWGTPFLYLFFFDSFPWKLYSAALYPALVTLGAWWKWPKWRWFVRTALQIEAVRYLFISVYFLFGLVVAHKDAAMSFVPMMAAALGAAIALLLVQVLLLEPKAACKEEEQKKGIGCILSFLLTLILAVTVMYVPHLENKARLQHSLHAADTAIRVFKFGSSEITDYAKDGRFAIIKKTYQHPQIDIYDAEKRQYLKMFETAKPVLNVVFSPDGRYVVAALRVAEKDQLEDTGLELWDLEAGVKVERFQKSPLMQERTEKKLYSGSRYLEFSPDGKYLIAGREIWNIQTGQLLRADEGVGWLNEQTYLSRKFAAVNMADLSINKIGERDFQTWQPTWAISPDGTKLGFYPFDEPDKETEIWDLEKKQILLRLGPESGKVSSMVFSPDGALLVTGGEGGIKAWDAATGALVKTIANGKAGKKMKFNAEGDKLLVFSTEIGACVIYKWE